MAHAKLVWLEKLKKNHAGNAQVEIRRKKGEEAAEQKKALARLELLQKLQASVESNEGDLSGLSYLEINALVENMQEFPDLAIRLPGLLENSAMFRGSWARMSSDYRDRRFEVALLCAPGRSVLGFSETSLG